MTYMGQVFVPELNRNVDLYDHPDNVPDSYGVSGQYAGVPQSTIPNASKGQQCYARPYSTPSAQPLDPDAYLNPSTNLLVPGVTPILMLAIIALFFVLVIAIIAYLILNFLLVSSTSSAPLGPTYTCPSGTKKAGQVCQDTKERLGALWYTYDCCNGTLKQETPNPTDWVTILLILVGVGAAAYVGFKIILPALAEKKEAKK